jgi:hypothetical protein
MRFVSNLAGIFYFILTDILYHKKYIHMNTRKFVTEIIAVNVLPHMIVCLYFDTQHCDLMFLTQRNVTDVCTVF